jgi:hypothetical protein
VINWGEGFLTLNVLLQVHFKFMLLCIYFAGEFFLTNTASKAANSFMNLFSADIDELLIALITLQRNGPKK